MANSLLIIVQVLNALVDALVEILGMLESFEL